jgi:hypothetical protein
MKVRELIKALADMDQDADVHFTYNYGDHWHTMVAPEVSSVHEGYVVHSDYHDMPKLVDPDDQYDDDFDEDDHPEVVVLSARGY